MLSPDTNCHRRVKMSKTYTINCSWEMYGHVDVEADSLDEAIEKVGNETQLSDINAEYVSESFKIEEMVVCLSQPTRKDES